MNHTNAISNRNIPVRNLFGKSVFLLMSILFATVAHASCPKPDTIYITSKDTSSGKWKSLPGKAGSLNHVEISGSPDGDPEHIIYCRYDTLRDKNEREKVTIQESKANRNLKLVFADPQEWKILTDSRIRQCDATKFKCEFDYSSSDQTLASPFNK